MVIPSYPFEPSTVPRRGSAELSTDYRARLALEKAERDERKRMELEEQRSEANSPRVRVLAWEKAHGLRMPADSEHPILFVIARATRLSIAEVRKEQQARAVGQAPV